MYDDSLRELEFISKSVGIPVEYTQGGGGNTSVKLTDDLMAVKASGYRLKQITPDDGYVIVNHMNIRNYFMNVNPNACTDFEKESKAVVAGNMIAQEGKKPLRPSVEAGFHSLLGKFVIHTHSVYANMVCCTGNGRETIERILGKSGYGFIFIPYVNPGPALTVRMNEEIKAHVAKTGKNPDAIFMENHGMVVAADESDACVRLHEEINGMIREYLGMSDAFPEIILSEIDANTVVSKTRYLKDFFKNSGLTAEYFEQTVLYPDQLVYLNGNISVDGLDGKVNIDTQTGEVLYKTGISEARTLEETLLAYVYVISGVKKNNFTLKTMTKDEIDFITNWESEAYRKKFLKEKKT